MDMITFKLEYRDALLITCGLYNRPSNRHLKNCGNNRLDLEILNI